MHSRVLAASVRVLARTQPRLASATLLQHQFRVAVPIAHRSQQLRSLSSPAASTSSPSAMSVLNLPEQDPTHSLAIVFADFGQPADVLAVTREPLLPVQDDEVLVAIVAASVNPSDINQIQGVYPSKPSFKLDAGFVPGNEGSAVVLRTGRNVTTLKRGDLVIPTFGGPGTWRQYAVWPASGCLRYGRAFSSVEEAKKAGEADPNGPQLNPDEAARLSVNPCTAFRMLRDFTDIGKGDVVIQNGANSAVGQAVIQFTKIAGGHTINVIRARETPEETDKVRKMLTSMGADVVITEQELEDGNGKISEQKFGKRAKLALNCVGGSISVKMTKEMEHSTPFVTYGAMSMKPLTVGAQHSIFFDIRFLGFWMSRWYKTSPISERVAMIEQIRKYKNEGKFKFPAPELELPFGKDIDALKATLKEIVGDKRGKRFLTFF